MAFATSTGLVSRPQAKRMNARCVRTITRMGSAETAEQVEEVERYLSKIAKAERPPYLDALVYAVTSNSKAEAMSPSARANLHPFLIPLAYDNESKRTTGLLRWPTPPEGMPLPVVTGTAEDPCLTLLSPSAKAYAERALAEADSIGNEERRDAIRAASSLAFAYQNGDSEKSGLGLERFLIISVGGFPDVYEGLAQFHLAKGDEPSALVTCEAAARAQAGWGRAHAFHANILKQLGRELEARDAARFCLQLPLWTIGSVEKVREMGEIAGYQDSQSLGKIYRRLYEDGRAEEIADGKPAAQVALDRAAWLLDVCVAEQEWTGEGWEDARERLAELYDEAGMNDLATFVRY